MSKIDCKILSKEIINPRRNNVKDKINNTVYFAYVSLTSIIIMAALQYNIPYLGRAYFSLYFAIGLGLVIIVSREKLKLIYPFLGLPGIIVFLRQILTDPYMQHLYFHLPKPVF